VPVYPYSIVVTRNLKQVIAPVRSAEVTVWDVVSGAQRELFPDSTEDAAALIVQPILTNANGETGTFYVGPGRIRVDMKLDSVTTNSLHLVIPDEDMNVVPVIGEVPGGDVDGTNTTFTLDQSVFGNNVSLYVNGTRWAKTSGSEVPTGQQFAVSAATITTGDPPGAGAVLLSDYVPVKA
jgi:hypothetical protein